MSTEITPDTSNHNSEYRPEYGPSEKAFSDERRIKSQPGLIPNIMPEHIERIIVTPMLVQLTEPDNAIKNLKPVTALYTEIILTEEGVKFFNQGQQDIKNGKGPEYSMWSGK